MNSFHSKTQAVTVALILLSPLAGFRLAYGQTGIDPPAPILEYTMTVRLDPAQRLLTGNATIHWRNTTETATSEMPFHLYLNAFRNNRSTFMREGGNQQRRNILEEGQWGWMEITSIKVDSGDERAQLLRFIQPDDGNDDDRTVVLLPLGRTVGPGETVRLKIDFIARLPHAFARTGFKGNFFMAGQWYPKPGVFQGTDGWNCHQFHADSEFFADFAHFDVTITVPQGYILGATGREILPPVTHPDGTISHHFIQARVHDFAWAADPDFVAITRHLRPGSEATPDLPPVDVTLLLQPEHAGHEERVFRAIFAGLRWLGTWYGPYPYETLTVVDPQQGARGAGGMEYPTLITIGSNWQAPAARLSPERVTIHEFGHQYWYGLVASNEFEEAWLDEGITTYTTGRVLDREYGQRSRGTSLAGFPVRGYPLLHLPPPPETESTGIRPTPLGIHLPPSPWPEDLKELKPAEWLLLYRLGLPSSSLLGGFRDVPFLTYLPDLPTGAVDGYRASYLSGPRKDRIQRTAWEYLDRASYGLNSYDRPALVLATLERLLGEETMTRALRTYQQRYRYGHPTGREFEQVISEVAGRDLGWLLGPLLRGNEILDYAVTSVEARELPAAAGVFGLGDERRLRGQGNGLPGQPPPAPAEGTSEDQEAARYRNEIVVRRLGAVAVPVVVEIEFEDGTVIHENWDGIYAWTRFVYEGTRRVRRATVDPKRVYAIDLNWSNNTRTALLSRRPVARWSLRFLLWMQNVLTFYSGLA
ncbi:MAG: M1 family peptidase [Acidobacteria bacterium]|nr:MAG: M1 family peptidase [Acidobacteriota bacterium]